MDFDFWKLETIDSEKLTSMPKQGEVFEIGEFKFEVTCIACPEQYDIFKDGNLVGYARLRHGRFSVRMPNSQGKVVFTDLINDFQSRNQRIEYLEKAANAIQHALDQDY
jgi:hypothetical protein